MRRMVRDLSRISSVSVVAILFLRLMFFSRSFLVISVVEKMTLSLRVISFRRNILSVSMFIVL